MSKVLNLTDQEAKALIVILRSQEEVNCEYDSDYKVARTIALIPIQSMLNKLGEKTDREVNDQS